MPPRTLRIIDANCNRISEGLRLLEDIARFLLNDANLSQQFKTMRHGLVDSLSRLGTDLLSQRNSEADVGASIGSASRRQDLPSIATANAKRAEEGFRVIEELARLPEMSTVLHSKDFQRARFNLYALERDLLSKLLRQDKLAQLRGLYVIIDTQVLAPKDGVEAADEAVHGGAKIIQLRDKRHDKGELLAIAQKLRDLCCKSGALFIMNDHLDIALAVGADGLHIGQTDLPLAVVRKELPVDRIVGCSARTSGQAQRAQAEGADYVAVGSIFPSPTRKDATVIGVERLRQIRQAISVPLVAIGGINRDNIAEVMAAGADSAAVISAVLAEKNIQRATRRLVKAIEQGIDKHR